MGQKKSRHDTKQTPAFTPAGYLTPSTGPHSPTTPSFDAVVFDAAGQFATSWTPPVLSLDTDMDVSRGLLQLGIDLMRQMRRTAVSSDANVVLSPYAVASVLEELLVGARGDTAAQIRAALRLPPGQRVSAYFSNRDREIPNRRRSDTQRRFDMGYLTNVHHEQSILTMDAEAQQMEVLRLERFAWDFANAAEESRRDIDHYARLYAGTFQPNEILPKGCIKSSSLVCMLSVVDFRGSWKHAFDDRSATRGVFFQSDGTKSAVVMLHQTGEFRLANCADLNARALELPYDLPGEASCTPTPKRCASIPHTPLDISTAEASWTSEEGRFSLVVLLPDELDGLATVEERLSAFTALQCFGQLRQQGEVHVSLPLFKVKQVTELIPVLSALGVRDLFSERAELWGSAAGEKRVSLIRHAVAFETAQTGGRRHSAPSKPTTGHFGGLLRTLSTVLRTPQPRARFTVDRPFAFFVTCTQPDAVMLLGSVRKVV